MEEALDEIVMNDAIILNKLNKIDLLYKQCKQSEELTKGVLEVVNSYNANITGRKEEKKSVEI